MQTLYKVFFIFVFFICSLNVYSQTKQEKSLAQLYKELRTSVVVLKVIESSTEEQQNTSGELHITTINAEGEGSGVLIDDDLILTAAHVVHKAGYLNAVFFDGVEINGTVISSDISTDLALVRLDKKHPSFKPAILGDSDKMEVGEAVFIIGAPFNISYTLTQGILSGRHHEGSDSDFFKSEYFQSDAALNPGNSGGPMFNMQGEIIGIASFIKSKSGGSEGLGFAVTSNSAQKTMVNQPRFYSGLTLEFVQGRLAKALNIPQESGLLVQSVIQNSDADKIGIKGGEISINYHGQSLLIGGDIILKIADIVLDNLQNAKKIQQHLLQLGELDSFPVTILRQGKTSVLTWKNTPK